MSTTTFVPANLADLQAFTDATSGLYLSALLPARSDAPDAARRLEEAWRHVRRQASGQWSATVLDRAEQAVSDAGHADGDSVAVIVPTSGTPFIEHLAGAPMTAMMLEGPLPAFGPIIEHRQRTIAHIVVDCDKAGADIVAFDGGAVIDADRVDGDELHIHRGHPGGWSQRRFQQRAENTWEANISEIADAVEALAAQVDARLIAVAGPTRAKTMLVTELGSRSTADRTVGLEAGDVDGIASEVVTLTDDVHARGITALSEEFRERSAHGTATGDEDAVFDALADGRVDGLLVADDWDADALLERELPGVPTGSRKIDAAIAAALGGGATVTVVPGLAALDGPLGAFLRW